MWRQTSTASHIEIRHTFPICVILFNQTLNVRASRNIDEMTERKKK